MPEFHAVISGRVQGVGFRYFVQRLAAQRNIKGFTRNLPDGDVEVAGQGPRPALDALLEDIQRGPSMSRVTNINVVWHEKEQHFDGFNIRF